MLGRDDFLIVFLPVLFVSSLVVAATRKRSVGRVVALVLVGAYAIGFASVTLFPVPVDVNYIRHLHSIGDTPVHNLVPGRTIVSAFAVSWDVFLYQIGGNLVLAAPLGFLLPTLWKRRESLVSTLRVGVGVILGLEVFQYLVSVAIGINYKSFDVDDILLNTAGLVLGWSSWRLLHVWLGDRTDWQELTDWLRGSPSLRAA